jgi:pyridoxine kinase
MARILAISSQVVFGPVGNTAATPALQALGHEVMQVPTILLSHHPGHGPPAADPVRDKFFAALLERTVKIAEPDAVLTGYFASAAQVVSAAKIIRTLKTTNPEMPVLVDPVIGDHGKLYVKEEIAKAIREKLLPLATMTTPNLFELQWLTASTAKIIPSAARRLDVKEVIVTSVPGRDKTEIGSMLVMAESAYVIHRPKEKAVPNGTGDFLAGAYLGNRLLFPPNIAFRKSMSRLRRVIGKSAGSTALAVTAK